ncbi:hypothetical protein ACWDSD_28475 [Streptomyces spiralis]
MSTATATSKFGVALRDPDARESVYGPSSSARGSRGCMPMSAHRARRRLARLGRCPRRHHAQDVLLSEVFGPLGDSLGIGSAAWVVILLWASKAGTYGPLPNANVVGPMGLARATQLPYLLSAG